MDALEWARVAFIVWQSVQAGNAITGAKPPPPAPPPAATAPRPAPPQAVVVPYTPPKEVAMVVLPEGEVYRWWFEDSIVAADYPREKGVPEPLPLEQWKELMDDLAVPYDCGGRRPTACDIPQTTHWASRRVFFDVVYVKEE